MNQTYIALLRGINVGGNNIIKMIDLKACFEDMGFEDVKTYIQSGNVIFSTTVSQDKLESLIEKKLSQRFDYKSTVVVITASKLQKIIDNAPKGFGSKPDEFKYDIIFLKKPLSASEALTQVKVREGVDTASAGEGVLYFSRLSSQRSKSHLSKIIQSKIYPQITIRNWNTTTKILNLLEKS